jgi:hypothetical protein
VKKANQPEGAERRPIRAASDFGSNEIRLTTSQWLVAIGLVLGTFAILPHAWKRIEPFEPPPDYRIPFVLSDDYWHYERWMDQLTDERRIPLIGDSAIWGEYVTPDETLSQFMNRQLETEQFANGGLNGTHPLALEGLVQHYCGSIRNRQVIVHCNLLWMSSAERDLQTEKELSFNHARLVPQLLRSIPAYRASTNDRIGNQIDHLFALRGLVHHWRIAHFDSLDLHSWSLEHPYDNPIVRLGHPLAATSRVPRHETISWTERGIEKQDMPWVEASTSLQFESFQRTIATLSARRNRVFVIIGPFNEHLLEPESARHYAVLKEDVAQWLTSESIPHHVAELLPSEEYGDASHPLAGGYRRLAQEIVGNESFQDWLGESF